MEFLSPANSWSRHHLADSIATAARTTEADFALDSDWDSDFEVELTLVLRLQGGKALHC